MGKIFQSKAEREAHILGLSDAALRRRGVMAAIPGIGHNLAGSLAISDGRLAEGAAHHGVALGSVFSAVDLRDAALLHKAKHLKYKGLLPVVGAAGLGTGGIAGYLLGRSHDK